jgi:cell division protein FtsB
VSALHRDYSSPAKGGIWPSLNRFMLTLIAVTLATTVGYRALPEVSRRKEQDLQIDALKAEIEHENQLLARRQREETLLKHDPEYIGMIARDRLDVMKEGETIFRLDPGHPDISKMHRVQ